MKIVSTISFYRIKNIISIALSFYAPNLKQKLKLNLIQSSKDFIIKIFDFGIHFILFSYSSNKISIYRVYIEVYTSLSI